MQVSLRPYFSFTLDGDQYPFPKVATKIQSLFRSDIMSPYPVSWIANWGSHKRKALRLFLSKMDEFRAEASDTQMQQLLKNQMAIFELLCEKYEPAYEVPNMIQLYSPEKLRNHVSYLFRHKKNGIPPSRDVTGPRYIIRGSQALSKEAHNNLKGGETDDWPKDDFAHWQIPARGNPREMSREPATASSPGTRLDSASTRSSGRKHFASRVDDVSEEPSRKRRMSSDTRDDDAIEDGMRSLSNGIVDLVKDYFQIAPFLGERTTHLTDLLQNRPVLKTVWATMFGCEMEQLDYLVHHLIASSGSCVGQLSAFDTLQALLGTYLTQCIFLGNRKERQWSTA